MPLLTANEKASLTHRARSGDDDAKGWVDHEVAIKALTLEVDDLSSQVSAAPASVLTTSEPIGTLKHVWIDGVLQYPPAGFITVTGTSTLTASIAIPQGKTIIVDYVKAGG